MDETLARHVMEAAEALRRLLDCEAPEVPSLPRPPPPPPPPPPATVTRQEAVAARQRPAAFAAARDASGTSRGSPVGSIPQFAPAFVDLGDLPEDLEALRAMVASCTRCPLHATRHLPVFGEGRTASPTVMFVGEGPGADEDRTGLPFVGAAGQLLDKMIAAMGLAREECFIGNVVKCRPPGNATPTPDQAGTCVPYLHAQIRALRPRFLVALGATAAHALTGIPDGVARQRGRVQRYGDIPLVVTYHPAALLRNAEYKRPTWADLQLVMARLRSG